MACDITRFCAWTGENYQGEPFVTELFPAGLRECVPMPPSLVALSFINRTGHPVTVFEDPACSLQGYFSTYSPETFVPRSDHVVRAFRIWSRNLARVTGPPTASPRATVRQIVAR